MPSILGKIRNSTGSPTSGTWSPTGLQSDAHEDDDRLLARLKAGYPSKDVKHILALADKHHHELDAHVDFVASWFPMVVEWARSITACLPALTASQRPVIVRLRAQAETYLSVAHLMALQHAQDGARLRVAHTLLEHARVWIELGRDRTHQRFEDFERAPERHGRRGSAERASHPHNDVATNLDSIANFLSELTSAESRLPHLRAELAEAAEQLLEGQEDLDEMVRSIEAAKGLIEGLVDGSAWSVGNRPSSLSLTMPAATQTDAPTHRHPSQNASTVGPGMAVPLAAPW
ncbi:hypothetical protein CspeluHIS016_0503190 [Cutaneotrichosporon spelunceum]|uniref:Uncharacterized protein n=1 Tax=Cutaneotrichosporon spelunceum TaxID=1672016 RepID=A0AAD3TXL0_9TREE|nr:hypothetical protein CspeluHIS016_0503190 [Cutaneotrichosporon spelunceum]